MKYTNQFFLVAVLFTFSLLTHFKGYSQRQPTKQTIFAIKNVSVITMTASSAVIENATVVISNNLIQSINETIPKNAKIIDGKGKWLIPGLIDMHVHLPSDFNFGKRFPTQLPDLAFNTQDIMTPYIANGVTTLLDLNSNTNHIVQKKKKLRKDMLLGLVWLWQH